ncbi:MAG: Piwi domain-containing protein [Promethearchaeota archaeon]
MPFLEGNKISDEPKLLFDKADPSAIHSQIYWGLRNFGPYDKELTEIRLGVICPDNVKTQVINLITDLQRGKPIFPGGMKRFFRVELTLEKIITLNSMDIQEYQNKSLEFIYNTTNRDIDVVLIYIPKTSKYFTETAYYRCKAIFASEGYSTQMITNDLFLNLKWSYLNLAVAIFSKAGGTPWVLQDELENTDMIMGISTSNIISKYRREGDLKRFIGFVNIFDNYGKWMFFQGTATPYSKENLIENLKILLNNAIIRFKSIKKYEPTNLFFHYYKKFSQIEKQRIIEILSEILPNFNVCFISIDDSHIFRIYNKSTNDGSFPRGNYVYLNENETLLSTTGFSTLTKYRMGTPKLLHIRANTNNNFISLDNITKQVFYLTRLNWATVSSINREPVTLHYSKELAYLTAALSELEWKHITSSSINQLLNKKVWFI